MIWMKREKLMDKGFRSELKIGCYQRHVHSNVWVAALDVSTSALHKDEFWKGLVQWKLLLQIFWALKNVGVELGMAIPWRFSLLEESRNRRRQFTIPRGSRKKESIPRGTEEFRGMGFCSFFRIYWYFWYYYPHYNRKY